MEPRTLPKDVFARLAPEIYLERLLDLGRRPEDRSFKQARDSIVRVDVCGSEQALGSAVARAGNATVVCGITGSLTQLSGEGGVYANVEIHRGGRSGHPTHEEMAMTQHVQNIVNAAEIPREQFIVGNNEVSLHAQLIILSRTGPPADLLWTALVAALESTKLPIWSQDERTDEWIPTVETIPLKMGQLPINHTSYGIFGEYLFHDLDGPVEERCINDRISYANNGEFFKNFSLGCPSGVELSTIEKVLTSE